MKRHFRYLKINPDEIIDSISVITVNLIRHGSISIQLIDGGNSMLFDYSDNRFDVGSMSDFYHDIDLLNEILRRL